MQDDQELITRAAAGDTAAFEALYLRYREFVYRLAFRFVRDEAAALDVSQEVFTFLIRKIPTLRLTGKLSTYLYPAVKNIALTQKRRVARERGEAAVERGVGDLPGVEPGDRDLVRAIEGLPEPQREVLLMRIVDEMSVEEVAMALSIPQGTVKSRLHLALASLREDERLRELLV